MKRILYLLFCIPLASMAQESKIIGDMLTTANGTRITIGSKIRILKPSKEPSRFSYIYNELSIRASSEEDMPSGLSSSSAGKEVKVKKFWQRKTLNGSKVYVITGGAFLNSAIDIEKAMAAGEVSVGENVPYAYSTGDVSNNNPIGNTTNKSTGLQSGGGLGLRRPWGASNSSVQSSSSSHGRKDTASKATLGQANSKIKDSAAVSAVGPMATSAPQAGAATPAVTSPVPAFNASSGGSMPAPPVVAQPAAVVKEAPLPQNNTSAADKTYTPSSDNYSETNKPMVAPTPVAESSNFTHLKPLEEKKPDAGAKPAESGDPKGSSAGYTKYTKLKQLKELYDSGALSKEEFEAEKRKILEGN